VIQVRVEVHGKDRRVGAMVKALAFEIGGPKSVEGAVKEFLEQHGHYVFHFRSSDDAREFQEAVGLYLPGLLARVIS
jgi:hypothetical protein